MQPRFLLLVLSVAAAVVLVYRAIGTNGPTVDDGPSASDVSTANDPPTANDASTPAGPASPSTMTAGAERAVERAVPASANRSAVPKQRWLIFLDQLGLGAALALSLKAHDQDVVTVREGDSFFQFGDDEYALSPEEGVEGYEQLRSRHHPS